MNSYFTNPSLSCHLTGGQEVLPNVALNSTAYDPVRHFSTYGAAVAQNRIYSSPFYSPQDNVVFSSSRGPYDYGSNAFYQEKDMLSSCRQNSMGHNTQTSIAQDFTSDQNRNTSQEQKTSIQIYPWMQRMNSHSAPSQLQLQAFYLLSCCKQIWLVMLFLIKRLRECKISIIKCSELCSGVKHQNIAGGEISFEARGESAVAWGRVP
uniref:Homeobox C6 n=1 Tax=Dromaius novaehollandiae TaxID=8790 RepID=A0A8C4P5A5_DRONO